jgi:hypothetical protein
MMNDQNAAQALELQPPEPEAAPETGGNSFFIPSDIVESTGYKEGDKTITLNVMGKDEDGDLEVCGPNATGGNWHEELRTELNKQGA